MFLAERLFHASSENQYRTREKLDRILSGATFEIFVPGKKMENLNFLDFLPDETQIAISRPSGKSPQATLESYKFIAQRYNHLHIVPHFAARSFRDQKEAIDIFRQLKDLGANDIFLIGGDEEKPVGEFDSTLQLMKTLHANGLLPQKIGLAAHQPDLRQKIPAKILTKALYEKLQFAKDTGTKIYVVTQMCSEAHKTIKLVAGVKDKFPDVTIIVGIPGKCSLSTLKRVAEDVGIENAYKFINSNPQIAMDLLLKGGSYDPTPLSQDLAKRDHGNRIGGVRLYTFNAISDTWKWQQGMLGNLYVSHQISPYQNAGTGTDLAIYN